MAESSLYFAFKFHVAQNWSLNELAIQECQQPRNIYKVPTKALSVAKGLGQDQSAKADTL